MMRPCGLVTALLSAVHCVPSCFSRVTVTSGEGRPSSRLSTCTLSGLPAARARDDRPLSSAPANRVLSVFMGFS
ncbi:hypothetical protein D3C78_1540790 [compost metagenome]